MLGIGATEVLPVMETFFNSWSTVMARALVCASGWSAGACLCGEVLGVWDLALTVINSKRW